MNDDLLAELRRQGQEWAGHARDVWKEWTGEDPAAWWAKNLASVGHVADELQYRVDREVGKALAQHPELYAEVRRGARRLRRTWEKVAEDLGLR